MIKQKGFVLLENDLNEFQEIVPQNSRRKALEAFLLKDYRLPENFEEYLSTSFQKISKNMRFSDNAISIIDNLVKEVIISGLDEFNQSLLMQDVIRQFNKHYQSTKFSSQKKSATFYTEVGAKQLLDQWIGGHRERSFRIERFLLEMDSSIQLPSYYMDPPKDYEPVRMKLSLEALNVIEKVKNNQKGIYSASSIMRFVIKEIIEQIANEPFSELLVKMKLKSTLEQYKQIAGHQKVEETVVDYLGIHPENIRSEEI
jgi:hypothetical protein